MEVGPEIRVRDGRWQLIGKDSPEFFDYRPGDVIFNAGQSREILKYGKIKNGKKRGEVFAQGSAFTSGTADGRAFSRWSGADSPGFYKPSYSNSGNSNSNKSKSSSGKEGTFEKVDWIEIAISRIERIIENFARTAGNAFETLGNRLIATSNQIESIKDEIYTQELAANRYLDEAKSVGLGYDLEQLVQNGAIDIDEYDKDTREIISEYQEWYEKALDCKDAITELNSALSECYQTAFDSIATHYDSLVDVVENSKTILDEVLSQSEEMGYIANPKFYEAQIAAEQKLIDLLSKKRDELISKRNESFEAGVIAEGSEAWMEMEAEINGCTESIEEAKTSILELNNEIRESEWDTFDYLRDLISQISDETNFLIDAISGKKLFTDNGQFTDEGLATVGLHGTNYNAYMAEADAYAKEVLKLNEQIAENPHDKDLLERRQELLEQQRDMISSAEDEKEAIKSLVEEGFDLEIESLEDLINKYTDSLDSMKDLYDYQKKVEDQSSEISLIQKQIHAYQFDTSEEGKATYQKLLKQLKDAERTLEETEYDRNIGEQKKLLDNLIDEYEETLNSRLDNIDALIEEMIAFANENSDIINKTISDTANSLGYTISDSLKNVWSGALTDVESALTIYTSDFTAQMTSVNKALDKIAADLASMLQASSDHANGVLGTTKQYKTGGLVKETGPAWLDGTSSDPELVLNAADTKNFLEMRDCLRKMSTQELTFTNASYDGIDRIVPIIRGMNMVSEELKNITSSPVSSNNSIVNYNSIEINTGPIRDYDDFMRKIQNDRKFEDMMERMICGKIVGGGSFEKKRISWK